MPAHAFCHVEFCVHILNLASYQLKLCIFLVSLLRALRGSHKQCPVVTLSMVSLLPQIRGIDPSSFFLVEEPEVQEH